MEKLRLHYVLSLLLMAVLLTACAKANQKVAVTEDAAEIKFDTLVYDYGTILPDTTTTCEFVFHNIGATPLYIESVIPSCGCTKALFPHGGIEPGEAGVITTIYDSHNRRPGHFQRSLRVYSNAKTGFCRLTVTGDIAEKPANKK